MVDYSEHESFFNTDEYIEFAPIELARTKAYASDRVYEYGAHGGEMDDMIEYIELVYDLAKIDDYQDYSRRYKEVTNKVREQARHYAVVNFGTEYWKSIPDLKAAVKKYKARKVGEWKITYGKLFWNTLHVRISSIMPLFTSSSMKLNSDLIEKETLRHSKLEQLRVWDEEREDDRESVSEDKVERLNVEVALLDVEIRMYQRMYARASMGTS